MAKSTHEAIADMYPDHADVIDTTASDVAGAEAVAAKPPTDVTTADSGAGTDSDSARGGVPDRVELFIPRGGSNEEPNLLIGINGKNYLLPRGKTSKVPPEVASEYRRAMRAQEMLDRKIDELRSDNS